MSDALVTTRLPLPLYSASQMRRLDRAAIERCGIPGIELMRRAGRAAFTLLRQRWPQAQRIVVLCGSGNNGGDGAFVAGLARREGLRPTLYFEGDSQARLRGDAALALAYAREQGVAIEALPEDAEFGAVDVLVDALLGTGAAGELRPSTARAVQALNAASAPVFSLDLPTGLCADSGRVLGTAVQADCTLSFIALKPGLLTASGRHLAGRLHHASLTVPAAAFDGVDPVAQRMDLDSVAALMPPLRRRDGHKGSYGHVLVIGGQSGMAGAPLLSALAAARTGAGLVSLATHHSHAAALAGAAPELMVLGLRTERELDPALAHASVLVIGPGLGQSDWSEQLLRRVLATDLPLVIDADALNLLATLDISLPASALCVSTPHPGEAARLLACPAAVVQDDRLAAVARLQHQLGGVVALKGSGTLVADGETISLCSDGGPALAIGGSGDVLSGVVGALLAQGLSLSAAARVAVCLHAKAGDLAAVEGGERGMMATDLLPWLRLLSQSPAGAKSL